MVHILKDLYKEWENKNYFYAGVDYKKYGFDMISYGTKLINKTKESLLNIKTLIEENAPFDILSVDMKVAYDSLKEILGEISSLGYDDVIFSKFCVGK